MWIVYLFFFWLCVFETWFFNCLSLYILHPGFYNKYIDACILEIKSWMSLNKLKLNDEKTEFLVMTSRNHQHKIHAHDIKVDSATIHASKSARNLGIIFDNNLCMDEHVKRICQTVYFHIRNVNSIRKNLTTETAATIIHALITSRIDNGNSLLTGISERLLCKLQLAQNAAARILTKTRKFEHITPILKELHWLPVRERIQFKLLILTWKSLKGVLHLWALFLKVLCIFSKNKATSDKVSYGSGQKCSKELKNHNFTSV